MPGTHQNVQNLGAGGLYGTNTSLGGGGTPVARSELDFLRLGVGRQPSAEYPQMATSERLELVEMTVVVLVLPLKMSQTH